jgi:spore maturation protein CgeB
MGGSMSPPNVDARHEVEQTRAVPQLTPDSRVLYLHSNTGELAKRLHRSRAALYNRLGYRVRLFDSTEHFAPTIFPYLDRLWKRKDAKLMAFYEALAPELDACEFFVHYNGGNIHPAYLEQFRCVKVYHCADDPDASRVMSRPVAREYDVCAISNVACLDMYRAWGCRRVFFWPLGSSFPDEALPSGFVEHAQRDVDIVFVGSKYGVTSVRFVGALFGLYKRRRFMEAIERQVKGLRAYGTGWSNGFMPDDELPALYGRSRLGLNKHNSLGPINFRLFDLAAFGIMQLCDNPEHLGSVYRLNEEVVAYRSLGECLELISYYLAHPERAEEIARAGRQRFERDYSAVPLWRNFVDTLNRHLASTR